MKIAFQGEPGAYSEQAVFNYFGNVETNPCKSFDEVFDAVVADDVKFGLIPIENSLAVASIKITICSCDMIYISLANICYECNIV